MTMKFTKAIPLSNIKIVNSYILHKQHKKLKNNPQSFLKYVHKKRPKLPTYKIKDLKCLRIQFINSIYFFVSCFFFGGELSSSFDGLGKIDLADLAFDLLIFENQISSLSSNTLIGVI